MTKVRRGGYVTIPLPKVGGGIWHLEKRRGSSNKEARPGGVSIYIGGSKLTGTWVRLRKEGRSRVNKHRVPKDHIGKGAGKDNYKSKWVF